MPRKPRVFVEGGIYHVYCRVTRREPVFKDPKVAGVFIDQLSKIKARDEFVLFAWVLMSNHYHLLLRTVSVPLWRTMASLQVGFTKRFNRFHGFIGPFWQGRYQAILVEDQRYFDQLLAYIHLNPVSAGLVTDPAQYEYSGHGELLGRSRVCLVDIDEALLAFGSSRARARRRYAQTIRGAREETWIGELPGHLPWWRRERSEPGGRTDIALHADTPIIDELGRSTAIERPEVGVREMIGRACELLETDRTCLEGPSRERKVVRAREAIALVGFERYSIRLKDIASELQKSQDTASRWLSRAAKRRREDEQFAQLVEVLDRSLAIGGDLAAFQGIEKKSEFIK